MCCVFSVQIYLTLIVINGYDDDSVMHVVECPSVCLAGRASVVCVADCG